jgi:hypothetical protein
MPVLAAGLADVLVVDPNPLVSGRVREHRLDPLAILLMHIADVVESEPHVPDPRAEAVAHFLQLIDGEHARASHPRHAEVDLLARERRTEQTRELQLQRRDLGAQVGA